MSNWGVTLKKTGLTEQRLNEEKAASNQVQENQSNLQSVSQENRGKTETYKDRQGSLAADAMYGQQDRYNSGGKKSRKSRKSRKGKSRKSRKGKKSRKSRK
jgi:uncharacterized membrane protein